MIKDLIVEKMTSFMENIRVPRVVCMDRATFRGLMSEMTPYYTFENPGEPCIYGMKIRIEEVKCHCGESWNSTHKCLPSLVNGPPPLIRIE